MTPLPLSGTAKMVTGAVEPGRRLLRLRAVENGPAHDADAALIRRDGDVAIARDQGFATA
jgi:hypothetical protein